VKNKLITISLSVLLLLLNVNVAYAAVNIKDNYNTPIKQTSDISSKLISSFSSNAVIVGGVLFLIMAIVAGYHMLSNSGDAEKFAAGKDIITYAMIGFLLIFGAYWIIQLIQFMLGLSSSDARIIQ
jgi:hypothetical protein